jgi:hypothetical protein
MRMRTTMILTMMVGITLIEACWAGCGVGHGIMR